MVLHTVEYGDCTGSSGATTIFSAEGALGRSFIHEGGHGLFKLRDEYDSATCSTNDGRGRGGPTNTWDTQALCRADADAEGWDRDGCYEFTTCQGGWWKLGDATLASDAERYADPTWRFIMLDGNYFDHGLGVAAERVIN